ncbi:pilin [Candidatus Gracilibacteria bacterium]|nr:pilin [Candidatus Gracilibacteria bacterium]
MKIITKIICSIVLTISMGISFSYADEINDNFSENTTLDNELTVKSEGVGTPSNPKDVRLDTGTKVEGKERNDKLKNFNDADDNFTGVDATQGDKGFFYFLVRIAKSLKNIFFAIATVYFLIIVLRLLFTENSEEEFGKFKKGILWITVGIIIMQIAYSLVITTQNQSISGGLANDLLKNIVIPLITLLETAASFFFIAIAIFAFYRMVTSSGDDEKAKTGKMSIFYAIIGFIVIKISGLIVKTTYSKTLCDDDNITCSGGVAEIEEGAGIIFKIINWLNGFVGIAVVIMIIYAGVQIIFSNGEEEKIKKAKTSIIYIFIGIFVLTMNYLILTFFLI